MTCRLPLPRVRQVDESNRGAPLSAAASLHRVTYLGAAVRAPKPKDAPIPHKGYMRTVAGLPCKNCGGEGYTQFCHGDQGKGLALKTDWRTGWPGGGPRPGARGCYDLICPGGILPQEERRFLEGFLGRRIRDRIHQMGLWPANLPRWPADEEGEN